MAAPSASSRQAAGLNREALPAGACDTHLHIYDPRHPYCASAALRPAPATVAQYLAVRRALGLERAVVVQPSSYGTDNRCTLQAVAELGRERTRAVVVVPPSVADADLAALHAGGARGIRINALRGAALDRRTIAGLCARIAPFGWHLQLHLPGRHIQAMQAWLRALPVPVVLDHFARLPPAATPEHEPARAAVYRLLDEGRLWLKLSAPYLVSTDGPPHFGDLAGLVDGLLQRAPERLLWGSDWPHPGWTAGGRPPPDGTALLRVVRDRLGGRTRTVLVDNPARLYGF